MANSEPQLFRSFWCARDCELSIDGETHFLNLAIGIAGQPDPASGMIVNLKYLQQTLEKLILDLRGLSFKDRSALQKQCEVLGQQGTRELCQNANLPRISLAGLKLRFSQPLRFESEWTPASGWQNFQNLNFEFGAEAEKIQQKSNGKDLVGLARESTGLLNPLEEGKIWSLRWSDKEFSMRNPLSKKTYILD